MSDSPHPWRQFSLALVTIELETAFLVGAGDGDNLVDATFVSDANGLPCIPGESLAGILRHALADGEDPDTHAECCRIFGFQRPGEEQDNGRASRLRISFAQVHDQNDRPVRFRGPSQANDPVLAFLRAGSIRDHVCIGMHGAVDDRAKFHDLVVPAGARFSFELCLSNECKPVELETLVGLLNRPDLRLGSKTRSGLGKFRVIHFRKASFDLSLPKHLERLGKLPTCLHEMALSPVLADPQVPPPPPGSHRVYGELVLNPIATWMIGGGVPTGREPKKSQKAGDARTESGWDRVPLTECRIRWNSQKSGQRGEIDQPLKAEFLVPGSSVKGALRHRTAFHARRLAGDQWLDPAKPRTPGFTEVENELFGEIRSNRNSTREGRPGRVFLADSYVRAEAPYVTLQHVSLDRFTQGPMDHLLYDEIALGAAEIRVPLSIDVETLSDLARESLDCALRDLCEGRLALGAGRGHGRFTGRVEWLSEARLLTMEKACR